MTVANKNDTDADLSSDASDNDVREMRTGDNAHGRDEVDLMRLKAYRPTGIADGTHTKITVTPAARVRLWHQSWKETPEPGYDEATGEVDLVFGPGDTKFKQMWVEILTESASVGDITIKFEYLGITDTVIATGVWVTKTDSQFATKTWAELDGTKWHNDVPANVYQALEQRGGTGEVLPHNIGQARNIRNVMAMEFAVTPADVVTLLPRVQFDVTRQTKFKSWKASVYSPNTPVLSSEKHWPILWETSNDDENTDDESLSPDAMGRLFVMDAPGFRIDTLGSGTEFFKYWKRANFREWVQVGFTPNSRPTSEASSGSKASLYVGWHTIIAAQKSNDVWNIMAGAEREIAEGPDITIGDAP